MYSRTIHGIEISHAQIHSMDFRVYHICAALNFKKYFDFSYSAAYRISGMSESSTAFVGCVYEKVSSARLLTFLLFCYRNNLGILLFNV